MELVAFIGLRHAPDHFLQAVQGPPVHFQHLVAIQTVGIRCKVIQIAQDEPAGVADAPVGFHQALENFLGNADVVGIVLRRHPQPQDFRAVFGNGVFRVDGVAAGFGHLFSFAVHDKAVGQDAFVGGPSAGSDGFQKGRVEPAPMLIGAFQVQIAGRAQLRPFFQHCRVADARIEPDIQNIDLLGELR